MGDGVEAVQGSQVRLVPLRRVVHGIRYRTDLHFPLLAFARLRRLADSLRRCVRDQSHIRDLRVFLQLQTDPTDRTREGKRETMSKYVGATGGRRGELLRN